MLLSNSDLEEARDPFELFSNWFDAARAGELNDPEAMALATVDAGGLPDVRMVLCKGFGSGSLVFFTNAESAKGVQLESSHKAAALFHWKSIRKQARFRGFVTVLDEDAADTYFHSRPRLSQIGAWASQQSRPLASRGELEKKVKEYATQFGESHIPRPSYWRGYRLQAQEVELWADGAYRLHDRVRFTRQGEEWSRQRLFP